MNHTIPASQTIYTMSTENPPVLHVAPSSNLLFETCDCFHGQIKDEAHNLNALDWDHINPATGPVFIEGAEPGDALKIYIANITFTGNGIMAAIPDVGIFGGDVTESNFRILKVEHDHIVFANGIKLSTRPMIGVIGTAPAGEAIPCGTPGNHGGNMDCTKIAPGSTLYLPVFQPGGLLAMGDVHAAMGDGEVMGTGVEIAAKIQVTVDLVKNCNLTQPLLEADGLVYSIASADTMETAAKEAAKAMRDMAAKKLQINADTAGMLLSAVGNLEICQIVDPKVTVRFGLPKKWVL